jgi:hypothetical protein
LYCAGSSCVSLFVFVFRSKWEVFLWLIFGASKVLGSQFFSHTFAFYTWKLSWEIQKHLLRRRRRTRRRRRRRRLPRRRSRRDVVVYNRVGSGYVDFFRRSFFFPQLSASCL